MGWLINSVLGCSSTWKPSVQSSSHLLTWSSGPFHCERPSVVFQLKRPPRKTRMTSSINYLLQLLPSTSWTVTTSTCVGLCFSYHHYFIITHLCKKTVVLTNNKLNQGRTSNLAGPKGFTLFTALSLLSPLSLPFFPLLPFRSAVGPSNAAMAT